MVQVQDSRFIYNWRKRKEEYPTYKRLLPEFQEHLEHFEEFIKAAGLGQLKLNQWEVVYVNHIPRGDLWNSLREWPVVFPGFYLPADSQEMESFNGAWQLILDDNLGRLHTEIRHSKTEEDIEVIRLQLTARGGITEEQSLDKGFELGHETIVNAFTRITSDTAHKHWKRRK